MKDGFFKFVKCTLARVLILVALISCARTKQQSIGERMLFERIHLGMGRQKVEALLGDPVVKIGNEVYYGKTPKVDQWQSPQAPASILIRYSGEGVVESKQFYGNNQEE
jgi:hypothetical protein